MADTPSQAERDPERAQTAALLARADLACPFGPSFFLTYLGRFVRDHCPDPNEQLPVVQVRLADGTTLDLCHIVGVSPHWVMLAVRGEGGHHEEMIIELVPFDQVRGVSIRTRHAKSGALGYAQTQAPQIIGAETLLRATMPMGPEHHHGETQS
jgi:hypothetical protein